MRTLLVVLFVGSVLGQSLHSPGKGKQEVSTSKQQAVFQSRPPQSAETSILAASPKQSQAEANTGKRNDQPENPWRKYLCEAFGPSYLSNWVLAVFALVGAGIALKTLNTINTQARISFIGLKATRVAASAAKQSATTAANSAKLAEMALYLTERADLLMEKVTPSIPRVFQPDIVFTLGFKNFGRTRADHVTVVAWLGVADAKQEEPPPEVAPTIVGAGDTFPIPLPMVGKCVTEETFAEIVNGKALLRFEGTVIYKDVFGFTHQTKCTGTYVPNELGFSIGEYRAD